MPNLGLSKRIYRILSWSSLAGLVLTIGLVLRKSAAPEVPYDPAAAARAERKFQAADQAKAAGQPSQVQLDPTELNSYLTQNLELDGQSQQSDGGQAQAGRNDGGSAVGGGEGAASSTKAHGAATAPASGDAPAGSMLTGVTGEEQPTLEQVQSAVKDVKVDMSGDVVKAYVIFDFHGKDMSLELDGHLRTDNGYLRFVPISGKLGSLPLPQSTLDAAVEKLMASPENREKLRLPDDVNDIQIVDGHAVISYK